MSDLYWRGGCLLVLAFVLAALRVWDKRLIARRREGCIEPEVRSYPEGCTCVRGALLDNPSCPHHRDSYWHL